MAARAKGGTSAGAMRSRASTRPRASRSGTVSVRASGSAAAAMISCASARGIVD